MLWRWWSAMLRYRYCSSGSGPGSAHSCASLTGGLPLSRRGRKGGGGGKRGGRTGLRLVGGCAFRMHDSRAPLDVFATHEPRMEAGLPRAVPSSLSTRAPSAAVASRAVRGSVAAPVTGEHVAPLFSFSEPPTPLVQLRLRETRHRRRTPAVGEHIAPLDVQALWRAGGEAAGGEELGQGVAAAQRHHKFIYVCHQHAHMLPPERQHAVAVLHAQVEISPALWHRQGWVSGQVGWRQAGEGSMRPVWWVGAATQQAWCRRRQQAAWRWAGISQRWSVGVARERRRKALEAGSGVNARRGMR